MLDPEATYQEGSRKNKRDVCYSRVAVKPGDSRRQSGQNESAQGADREVYPKKIGNLGLRDVFSLHGGCRKACVPKNCQKPGDRSHHGHKTEISWRQQACEDDRRGKVQPELRCLG